MRIHMRAFSLTLSILGMTGALIATLFTFVQLGFKFWLAVLLLLVSTCYVYFEIENIYKTIFERRDK
jgi:hypothetical protein